ncbi:hypothetical protein PI125_g12326 [Phytophthora idaei]|nr:hypothetical protein PI125_g12326 [Phytophthora idaei]
MTFAVRCERMRAQKVILAARVPAWAKFLASRPRRSLKRLLDDTTDINQKQSPSKPKEKKLKKDDPSLEILANAALLQSIGHTV